MSARVALIPATILLVVAAAVGMAALAASPPLAEAAGPCKKWGKRGPAQLKPSQARRAVLCLINTRRKRAGLGTLDRNRKLQRAAQKHNNRMRGTGCFSHQCSGEPALDTRLRKVGYLEGGLSRWAYGENIAWGMRGKGTPKKIVKAWMKSSGHRANILSRQFKHIGIGFHEGTPSSKRAPGGIFTTDFGLRQG